jgi:hypothetical protein
VYQIKNERPLVLYLIHFHDRVGFCLSAVFIYARKEACN